MADHYVVRKARKTYRCEIRDIFGPSLAVSQCTQTINPGDRYIEVSIGEHHVGERYCMPCAMRWAEIGRLPRPLLPHTNQ
jgi:hypothetical protein